MNTYQVNNIIFKENKGSRLLKCKIYNKLHHLSCIQHELLHIDPQSAPCNSILNRSSKLYTHTHTYMYVLLYCSWCPACSGHNSDYTKAHRCTTAYQVDWGFSLNSSLHHLLLIQQNTLSLSLVFLLHFPLFIYRPIPLQFIMTICTAYLSPFLSLASTKVTMCSHV